MGVVIQLDPFIIAEDHIKDMVEEREKMKEETARLDGQKEALSMKIQEREQQLLDARDRAEAARKAGNSIALGAAAREMQRWQEFIDRLKPLRDNLDAVGAHLNRIYDNSKYLIDDAKGELEMKRDLYKSVTQGNKALSSALRLFNGDPEKRMLVEQSMEFLKDDIAQKLANMKQSIRLTNEIVEGIDLENATYEEKGMRLLAQMSEDGNFKLDRIPDPIAIPVAHPRASGHTDLLR